jgi:DNA-binding beta-propeller fold protein YncE
VTDSGSNAMSVIDTAANTVITTNYNSGNVSVIFIVPTGP